LFGGKGGVGKTTCSAAQAIKFALKGKTTLLFSTDPAHSLADSFEANLSQGINPFPQIPNLFLYEINAEEVFGKFREEYHVEIKDLLTTCSYLDQDDLDDLLHLSIPGLDELMGLKTVTDFMDSHEFDVYVWDTAPTGHTLRLLTLPGIIDEWIITVARMKWKYFDMMRGFKRRDVFDPQEDILLKMKKLIKKVSSLLKNPGSSHFTIVMIPEKMVIEESRRMAAQLHSYGISVSRVIVNNVYPYNEDCDFCREKSRGQSGYLEEIVNDFRGKEIKIVPAQPREVKGIPLLSFFAKFL
jgi:arsenite-transporting ATPase